MTEPVAEAQETVQGSRLARLVPDLPFPVVLLLASLVIGLASGMDDAGFLAVFNQGYAKNMGYFAVLLFCSFFLAAAISTGDPLGLGRLGLVLSPLTGAGMVCPDTSYATLSPIAGRHRRGVAVGSYSGFKLLIPAGPLIIGVGLSADMGRPGFILMGFALTAATMLSGLGWLRLTGRKADPVDGPPPASATDRRTLRRLFPLYCLGTLLLAGFALDLQRQPTLRFLTSPLGALVVTSLLTYWLVAPGRRRECIDAAMDRTAPLLLVIGAATALGAMLAGAMPLGELASAFAARYSRWSLVAVLFGVTAVFKMINGSSMATFAAVPPILSPVVVAASLDRTAAVYAICLGAFVAILPNDSYFWLTQPAAPGDGARRATDFTLTAVSIVQGLVGLVCLYGLLLIGWAW